MRNDHNLEVLSDALNAVLLACDFDTCADPRAFVRKENSLVDAAIECGMAYDHANPNEWAAIEVAHWLEAA